MVVLARTNILGECAMNRSLKRQFDKEFKALLRTKGDNCSVCGRVFQHNDRTFGGFNNYGKVAVVGDCCSDKLTAIYASGVFTTRNNDALATLASTSSPEDAPSLSPEEVERAVNSMQAHFNGLDDISAQLLRRAGVTVPKERVNLSLAPTPWKEDDASWFAAHSERSHRMRPSFPGEFGSIERDFLTPPEHHEVQTLVRQIEPGRRIRTPFCRDMRTPIPDLEPLLHAIYDLVSKSGGAARVLPVAEVAELAMKYADMEDGGSSVN